ncbi:MAG: hypothetical protein H6818_19470 [Phycisphaerales bacterium]|nr:hypothetical protein [Phycisphaerales bacterium]MCB9863646.1 hypothetical protein [Phycisphaerales bacterium]
MPDARTLTPATTAIDALAAPPHSGDILIEPSADRLIAAARANRALRQSYRFNLLDRPADAWLADRTRDDAPLVVMSGHQPEFIHPGVWIKHVFGHYLARRLNGALQFLIVDSDVPVVLRLEWPIIMDNLASIDSARADAIMNWRSYEYIHDRKEIDFAAIFDAARSRYAGNDASPLEAFAAAMLAPQASGSYVDRWIAGLTHCDASLGVPPSQFTRISRRFGFASTCHDDAAAALVAHIIVEAHEFRAAYNNALHDYRKRRNIAGKQHPIPDLAETQRRIETPFWLTHPDRGRERLYATPCTTSGSVMIFAGDAPLAEIRVPDLMASPSTALAGALGDWGIRPRALAQTLYARMFACDLFLHGIGGAKYDQITDDIIRRFFHVEPPAFGCVSATLRLELPTFDAPADALDRAERQRRDLTYNPQRYLDGIQSTALADHIAERNEAIAESDRLRKDERTNRQGRKAAYHRIQSANRKILDQLPDRMAAMNDRIAQLSREIAHNRIASSREWFFALYTVPQLRELRDKARQAIDRAAE